MCESACEMRKAHEEAARDLQECRGSLRKACNESARSCEKSAWVAELVQVVSDLV
jgi:hypothetical protein